MIIATLTTRRNEIAVQIRELKESLTHIDATIKLFQDDAPKLKKPRYEGLTRVIFDVLRDADKPLTTSEIAGMIEANASRVGISLAAQKNKGLVTGRREGRECVWGIITPRQ